MSLPTYLWYFLFITPLTLNLERGAFSAWAVRPAGWGARTSASVLEETEVNEFCCSRPRWADRSSEGPHFAGSVFEGHPFFGQCSTPLPTLLWVMGSLSLRLLRAGTQSLRLRTGRIELRARVTEGLGTKWDVNFHSLFPNMYKPEGWSVGMSQWLKRWHAISLDRAFPSDFYREGLAWSWGLSLCKV